MPLGNNLGHRPARAAGRKGTFLKGKAARLTARGLRQPLPARLPQRCLWHARPTILAARPVQIRFETVKADFDESVRRVHPAARRQCVR